jgi:nucleoside-diphosphate kinase
MSLLAIHPKQEKTFLMLKPDAVKRGLIGEIVSRVERVGLKIVAAKLFQATEEQIDDHYPKEKEWITRLGHKTLDTYEKYGKDAEQELGTKDPYEIGQKVRQWLIDFMISGPMVKMVIEGLHAIDMVRKMVGHTIPAKADMGTIRADYSVDSPVLANTEKRAVANLVHASETPKEAKHEIEYWFAPEEIHSYERNGRN